MFNAIGDEESREELRIVTAALKRYLNYIKSKLTVEDLEDPKLLENLFVMDLVVMNNEKTLEAANKPSPIDEIIEKSKDGLGH